MKKLFGFFALVAIATLMSCSGSYKTPSDVAKQGVKYVQEKNWEGYVDLLYFSDAIKKEDVEKTKQQYLGMLKGKMEEKLKETKGIKSYDVLSEEVQDSTAVVKMKITYGDDSVKEENMKTRLTKDGSWLLDSGK